MLRVGPCRSACPRCPAGKRRCAREERVSIDDTAICFAAQRQRYIRRLSPTKTLASSPAELVHEPLTMAYSGSMTNVSGTKDKASAGDPIPPKCSVIEVH